MKKLSATFLTFGGVFLLVLIISVSIVSLTQGAEGGNAQLVPVNDETQFCRETCGLGSGKPTGDFFGYDSANRCLQDCFAVKGVSSASGTCDPQRSDNCCNLFATSDLDCAVDADKDGFFATGTRGYTLGNDCNDLDATVNPAAAEACNSRDDDCDGAVDDGFGIGSACDGVGACGAGRLECSSSLTTRCSTMPGGSRDQSTPEACDSLDNDCNGVIDNGCSCTNGATLECYTGPGTTWQNGECHRGTQTCSDSMWGTCTGEQTPRTESCNGRDDDCDGGVDDGFGIGAACDGVGACGAGRLECSSSLTTRCSTMPGGSRDQSKPEVCDGNDNDCDGAVDEGLLACLCTSGVDVSVDPLNCGGCGIVCSSNNIALPSCTNGQCNGPCDPGWVDCNSDKRSDGCEVNTQSDINNCGGCGLVCSSTNNVPSCINSVCSGSCDAGFVDCDGNKLSNGCETDIATDPRHCGGCGIVCPSGICSGGICR